MHMYKFTCIIKTPYNRTLPNKKMGTLQQPILDKYINIVSFLQKCYYLHNIDRWIVPIYNLNVSFSYKRWIAVSVTSMLLLISRSHTRDTRPSPRQFKCHMVQTHSLHSHTTSSCKMVTTAQQQRNYPSPAPPQIWESRRATVPPCCPVCSLRLPYSSSKDCWCCPEGAKTLKH